MNFVAFFDNRFSFFFPQKLEEVYSPINGKIVVEKFRGKISVKVGGLSQSGGLVENLWQEGLKNLNIFPKKILILGLGAGTLANLLSKKFPDAKTIGVEIDPVMINLGKKYFNLNKIKNLSIKIIDAEKYSDKNKYDLIFVDLYLADIFPKNFENNIFLKKISKKLTKTGMVIFNRLYYANHIFKAKIFLDKLSKIFKYCISKNIKYNTLVFAKN